MVPSSPGGDDSSEPKVVSSASVAMGTATCRDCPKRMRVAAVAKSMTRPIWVWEVQVGFSWVLGLSLESKGANTVLCD
jgi:hypothetical protein